MAERNFKKGNQWQFSKDCQPSRRMTAKQTLKALDNLICMSAEELAEFSNNIEAPQFLVTAARKIIEGDLTYVVNLRNMYSETLG